MGRSEFWHPTKQAHAVELLDNFLTGDVKRDSFPLLR